MNHRAELEWATPRWLSSIGIGMGLFLSLSLIRLSKLEWAAPRWLSSSGIGNEYVANLSFETIDFDLEHFATFLKW